MTQLQFLPLFLQLLPLQLDPAEDALEVRLRQQPAEPVGVHPVQVGGEAVDLGLEGLGSFPRLLCFPAFSTASRATGSSSSGFRYVWHTSRTLAITASVTVFSLMEWQVQAPALVKR